MTVVDTAVTDALSALADLAPKDQARWLAEAEGKWLTTDEVAAVAKAVEPSNEPATQ